MTNNTPHPDSVPYELSELRKEVMMLSNFVSGLASAHELLMGLFIAGRLANPAGTSQVADTLIPQLKTLADMVVDHCRLNPADLGSAKGGK